MIVQREELKNYFSHFDVTFEDTNVSSIVRSSNVQVTAYSYRAFQQTLILVTCTSDVNNCNMRKLSIMLWSPFDMPNTYTNVYEVLNMFKPLFDDNSFKEDFYGKFSEEHIPMLKRMLNSLAKTVFAGRILEYCVCLSEGYKVEDTFINLEEYIYGDKE